jgi:hypothetical protein
MMKRRFKVAVVVAILLFLSLGMLGASGKKEESSATRGKYLAERGLISPPEEIHEDSYIGAVDYHYPEPENSFGVTLYSGHRQVSTQGQEEIMVIGIQGKRIPFEELPPLNLAFVIDKSGSMSDQDKMSWVKASFDIFIRRVRDKDFVSLVVFDRDAKVVFPSTQMTGSNVRRLFKSAVDSVRPGGGTNLRAGLELGYKEVMSNYRDDYTNWVLFLTDGRGSSSGMFEMAETYRDLGIGISTIGLGENFDLQLMRTLAERGGGSSRFISDRRRMEEIFGSGLSRMIVPVVKDVELELELLQNIALQSTWGADHRIRGQKIFYSLSSVHLGDYETIVVQTRIPRQNVQGMKAIARLEVSYRSMEGRTARLRPIELEAKFVPMENPIDGISDAIVLKAGTMLHFAQALKRIGEEYYGPRNIRRALELTNDIKKELLNARQRLDYEGFEEELTVCERYLKILGGDMQLAEQEIDRIVKDTEIAPSGRDRDLVDCLKNLFEEMTLDMKTRKPGNIAISGFSFKDGRDAELIGLLNRTGESYLFQLSRFTVLERDNLEAVLAEQELSLSDLMDTTKAVRVGQLLSAHYMLTGTVVEMSRSVVIFGRIINVETSAIESAGQVIVPRNRELNSLL